MSHSSEFRQYNCRFAPNHSKTVCELISGCSVILLVTPSKQHQVQLIGHVIDWLCDLGGPRWSYVNRGTIGKTNGMPIWVENGSWQPWVKLQSVVLSEFVVKVPCGDGKVSRTICTQSTIHWFTNGNEPDIWKGIKNHIITTAIFETSEIVMPFCSGPIMMWSCFYEQPWKMWRIWIERRPSLLSMFFYAYVLSPSTRASSVSCSMCAQSHWEYSKRNHLQKKRW